MSSKFIIILISFFSVYSYAEVIEKSVPDYTNINMNDNVSAKLAKLNQDYQIAQAQQKIDQLSSNKNGHNNKTGEIVVTGVMINEAGNRLATLRFPDGGTFDVEVGSILRNMKVTNINMNGVIMTSLNECKSRRCKPKNIFYARVFDAPQYSGTNTQIQNGVNTPTPFSSNSMVPPILGGE